MNQTDFIRERKLSFSNLIMFLLRGVHKTLSVELSNFFSGLKDENSGFTKQALSKARMKIRHTGFVQINDTVVESYYSENGYKEYKGYRLIAIDGAMVELPISHEIEEKYGKYNNKAHWVNSGWSMTAFDMLNEIVLESKLHRSGISEREKLVELLKDFKNKGKQRRDIIVADRGFPSLAVFTELKRMSMDFVIRYNGSQFLREVKDFPQSNENDKIVEVSLLGEGRRQRSGELAKLIAQGAKNKLTIRVVKIPLANGTVEFLATSLLDRELFTVEDLKRIYFLRWQIEGGFKQLKNTMELENISGKTEETALQDYYAKVIMHNLHKIVVQSAQEELNRKTSETRNQLKYQEYKINENVSYGLVREKIVELLNNPNGNWEDTFEHLVKIVQINPIPKREGRHYERKRKWTYKFPLNMRRST